MGSLFRHRQSKKLYTIEHLIHDIYHLNRNGFAGVYAYPYHCGDELIKFYSKDVIECKKFVDDNFEKCAEL